MKKNTLLVHKYRQKLCSGYLTKIGQESYYHRTSEIDPILASGRLRTLASRVKSPGTMDEEANVESNRWGRQRKRLSVQEAIQLLKAAGKDPDKIFLTKGGPIDDEAYGSYIIEKDPKGLPDVQPSNILNLIPNEYYHREDIPLQQAATIYTPTLTEAEALRQKYPHLSIKPKEELSAHPLPAKSYTSFLQKIINQFPFAKTGADLSKMTEKTLKKKVDPNAMLVGSKGLGIDIPGADTDIFIPYSTIASLEKARKSLKNKYNLQESPYNINHKNRVILRDPTNHVDIALALKKDAASYMNSYQHAKKNITPEQRKRIKKEKMEIKDAWFFPGIRYANYKRSLASQLGLKHF